MLKLEGYDSFLVFFIIACLIPFLALNIGGVLKLRFSSPSAEKRTTYESGIEPMGQAWIQFNIRYYMFALVFVIFDVETIFLYPWAVSFSQIGITAFIEALIFISILIIGLIFAWRKGALEWS